MLQLQRIDPKMGSQREPDYRMPFGYEIEDAASAFPFPSAPEPAPGPSILDADESKYLEKFFTDVSSEQYNSDFFNVDGGQMNFGWHAELPPDFMGTSSSFGQEPSQTPTAFGDMNFGGLHSPLGTPSTQDVRTEDLKVPASAADIFEVAPLLQMLQRGQHGSTSAFGRSNNPTSDIFSGQNSLQPGVSRQPLARSQTTGPHSTPRQRPRPQARATAPEQPLPDDYYVSMLLGAPEASRQMNRAKHLAANPGLNWGSDAGFNNGPNFIAPANQESVEAVEGRLTHRVEYIAEVNSSTTTTGPPTPVASGPTHTQAENRPTERSESKAKRPKLNKSIDSSLEAEDMTPVSKTHPRKRRGNRSSEAMLEPTGALSKRRKSTNAAAKPPRENLTEEQKRENHIKSEQKRRHMIKEGFDGIGTIVPGLRSGGFSKSAMLSMAADFISDMARGNEELRVMLRRLKEARGFPVDDEKVDS